MNQSTEADFHTSAHQEAMVDLKTTGFKKVHSFRTLWCCMGGHKARPRMSIAQAHTDDDGAPLMLTPEGGGGAMARSFE